MISNELKINIFCVMMIFLTIIDTTYFIVYNKRIGGNILNEGSEIINDVYYIVDNEGNKTKISKKTWNDCKKTNVVFFIIASLGTLSAFYLFCRYIYIPSSKANYNKLMDFIKNPK